MSRSSALGMMRVGSNWDAHPRLEELFWTFRRETLLDECYVRHEIRRGKLRSPNDLEILQFTGIPKQISTYFERAAHIDFRRYSASGLGHFLILYVLQRRHWVQSESEIRAVVGE